MKRLFFKSKHGLPPQVNAAAFKRGFTPLENAVAFKQRSLSLKADGGILAKDGIPLQREKPLSAQTVGERSSLTGFTLVEVIFSVGILVFTVCGLLVSYTSGMVLIATSKNTNIATNAAMGLMDQIRIDSFSQIVNDYDGLVFNVNAIPSSAGVVYVDSTNPEFLKVTIGICWRQGSRVIGGDTNLNGVLDAGEAGTGGIIDSPVQLVTQIANK